MNGRARRDRRWTQSPVLIPPAAARHSSVLVKMLYKCDHADAADFLDDQLANVPESVPSPPPPCRRRGGGDRQL